MPATARLEARTTPETLALLKRAAELEGRSLTDFVVAAASAAARQTLEGMHVLRLSEESSRFVAAMLAEDVNRPLSGLEGAIENYKRLVVPQ